MIDHEWSHEAWVERFEAPERVVWQRPAEVVATLDVHRGQRVADIGAGTGYFAIPLGRAVGRKGRVHAVELDAGRVAYLERRVKAERAPMVEPVLGRSDDPCLPGGLDVVFLCNTYHHIQHRSAYFGRVVEALADGGRLVVLDWRPSSPMGPPASAKVTAREVAREMRALGLGLLARETFLPHQYLLVFGRRRRTPGHHFAAKLAGRTRAP